MRSRLSGLVHLASNVFLFFWRKTKSITFLLASPRILHRLSHTESEMKITFKFVLCVAVLLTVAALADAQEPENEPVKKRSWKFWKKGGTDEEPQSSFDLGAISYPLVESVLKVYAGLQSFKALQSPDPSDDKQWLTFWLMFACYEYIIFGFGVVGYFIPFYDEMKMAFVLYLGVFNGAGKLYPLFEPLFLKADEVAKKYEPIVAAAKQNEWIAQGEKSRADAAMNKK